MGVASTQGPLVRAGGDASREIENGKTYTIYASTASKQPGEDVQILKAGTPTDKFVASLNKEQDIILSGTPNLTADLADTDKTRKWFQSFDTGATGSVSLDNVNDKNIEKFTVSLTAPWALTFNSAVDVLLFTFGSSNGLIGGGAEPRFVSPGIDANGKMLTLGLDFTKTKDITGVKLGDLFKYVGAQNMVDYFLPKKLSALPLTLKQPGGKDDPKRNALWLVPGADMSTTIRLQFQFEQLTYLQNLLSIGLKGLTLTSADAVCKRKLVLGQTDKGPLPVDQGTVALSIGCTVKGSNGSAPEVKMVAGVEFGPRSLSLTFIFLSESPLKGLLMWLAELIDEPDLEEFINGLLSKKEGSLSVLSATTLRRFTVGLKTESGKYSPKLANLSFDIEVTANIGTAKSGKPAVFLLSYRWNRDTGGLGTLEGQLWNDTTPTDNLDLQPWVETWNILVPVTKDAAPSIEIASLIPGQTVVNIPDTLPSEISRAYIQLSDHSFAISGTATAKKITPGSAPQPYLGQISLDASFEWGNSNTAFVLKFAFSAGIVPSVSAKHQVPAVLVGSLSYESQAKKWELNASLSNLYASTLVEFFDDDVKDAVCPLIESIVIDSLKVQYTYEGITEGTDKGKSKGTSFSINGDLLIAGLELDLAFTHDKTGFKFTAFLNPVDVNVTIGDVLEDILGDDEIELPDFVANTPLVTDNKKAFQLDVEKKTATIGKVESTWFHFLAQLNLGPVHVKFAQLRSSDWGKTASSKRLIQVAVDGFSNEKVTIPLVGDVQQPLDELYFLWVQDPDSAKNPQPGKEAGLTRKDLAQVNNGSTDPILVKDKIDPNLAKDTDILVAAGCHFAVIIHSPTGERSCLLDYAFMKPKPKTKQSQSGSEKALVLKSGKGKKEEPADDGSPSAQAPFKKKAGPISISNVGLKYKEKKLGLKFDAAFELGPVGFSLIGFTIMVDIKSLRSTPSFSASIEGLAAAFDKPPLTIAGIIRHGNTGGIDYYAGGLIVGWVPYQFQAAGFYGTVTPKDQEAFKSVFVFAKLDGPLITLEFAEISGICGGFGYNSNVRVPKAEEIYQFPFIASTDLGGAANAMEALQKLIDPGPSGWFQPLNDTYWAAVGMKIDAFEMISLDAVVVVQFGQAIKLGIFALALADIPNAKSPTKFAHVELGIAAVADFEYGTLKIEAQLSPRSFILVQDCHLTGGMGLYYWFDAPKADQSVVGDFVFTLGGYHQAYLVPAGYPNPPRLGISWSIGSNLSITGQAYFAITPKACMGGGRLHASFSAGPLEAWFDAFADFLINYKPFHFNAQAGLSVGVRFNIDFLFIHTHISVEIGAQLYLWGPPLAGRVHVDFWIVAFDINFGDSEQKVEAVDLLKFYQLVLQASKDQSQTAQAFITMGEATEEEEEEEEKTAMLADDDKYPDPDKNEAHNFLAQTGLLNDVESPERKPNDPWVVRAGSFSFIVACKMAINEFKNEKGKDPIIKGGDVFSKPMQLDQSMTSTLLVTVAQNNKEDSGWQYEKYTKNVPRALWAKYDPSLDPSGGKNNINDLLKGDDSSVTLMMGVKLTAPKAQIAPDPFPAFDVADASLQRLWATKPFPTIANANTAWEPVEPFKKKDEDEKEVEDFEKQYAAVLDNWSNPSWGTEDDGQKGFVGILAESFKWDKPDALKSIAGIPERLKKGFMNMYVAAPLLTA
ncbi:hypothetical protein V8C35DRAFT_329162 [Trichoderma chlorosporum]